MLPVNIGTVPLGTALNFAPVSCATPTVLHNGQGVNVRHTCAESRESAGRSPQGG
jgi:hypothetical protein